MSIHSRLSAPRFKVIQLENGTALNTRPSLLTRKLTGTQSTCLDTSETLETRWPTLLWPRNGIMTAWISLLMTLTTIRNRQETAGSSMPLVGGTTIAGTHAWPVKSTVHFLHGFHCVILTMSPTKYYGQPEWWSETTLTEVEDNLWLWKKICSTQSS